ncbi:apolipoprotein N-acyltransferase [Armatimonas sp.]|uniref:apolipoprotein N-acyltransferase n=1 Tax=Armatimonas sp. TaxID=1872638 RepID=UPI00374D31F2
MPLTQRLIFAALSGVLLAAAFPPYHLPYFLPLAVTALLKALEGATPRQGFYIGVLSSGIHTGATLFWLANLFASAVVPLCAIVAFFPILFCTLWPWLASPRAARDPLRRVSRFAGAKGVMAAVFWVGLEFYRAELFALNFGWSTLGYCVAGRPVFTPLAASFGVYGISFLAFFLGTLKGRALALATTLWAVACVVPLSAPQPERPLRVLLVQAYGDEEALFKLSAPPVGAAGLPSVASSATKGVPPMKNPHGPKGPSQPQARQSPRSHRGDEDLEVILWPEHAFHSDPRVPGKLKFENYWPRLQALAQKNNAHLIFGAHVATGADSDKQYENSAFVLNPQGELIGVHAKNHPVHFVTDGIASQTAKAIPTTLGRLGVPICFDNDYPEVDRRLVQDGAEVLLVPNMDPNEWGSVQHAQHSLLFAMRAMENGRWLARADVDGGTSAVAPNGVEIAHVKNGEPQTLKVTLGRTSHQTLYSLGGWIFGPLCLIGAVSVVVFSCARRVFNKRAPVE